MKRAAAGIAALALAGCAAPPPTQAPAVAAPAAPSIRPLAELAGKWRMVQSTVTFADGTSRSNASTSPCLLEIKPDHVVSTCMISGKETRIVTRVNCPEGIQRERLCDGVMVENSLLPKFVGQVSKVGYRIDGNKLTVSAYPAPKPPEKLPVSVISVLVRE